MLKTLEGIYRKGKVELLEQPADLPEARVIVTFLPPKHVDLRERGISKQQAAEMRAKIGMIAEDWDRPEMDVYDEL